ncbi:MAG: periplasmic heavy metal sensor [Gemmatimonadota bacterium]|jgi:Spy/CpxP family protein refolding chaperone
MKMTIRGLWLTLAVLLAAGLGPSHIQGQRRPGMGPGQNRADLERRIRARFGEMVRERLDLDDERAQRLNETVQSFQEDRSTLFREEQALRRRVEAVLLEGDPEAEEARGLVERMQELRLEEARLFQREQQALLEFLTPIQLLRLHALREQMGQRIRQLRGGPGPGRRLEGGGVPPGFLPLDGLPLGPHV